MKKLKTLDDFTPEIKSKIPEYIAAYTKGVFDGGRYQNFNKEDADSLIHWNYEKCNYKKPVILVAGNPYEAQIFFNHIKKNKEIFTPVLYVVYCLKNGIELPKELSEIAKHSQLYSQLDSQLGSQLRSQLRSQLDSQLYSQLDSQLGSQLGSQLRSQLDSQLYSQLDSQLYSQLDSQLYSQLDSQLGSQLRSQLDSQLGSQLGSQLRSQLRSQLYSQLRSQLYSQLDSQLGSQLYSQLRSQLYSQLDSQLGSQLRSQLRSQLGSQLRSQLDSQLDSQLGSQLRSQLDSQLYSQLDSQLGSQLYSQLRSQLGSQLRSQLDSQLGSQLYSQLRSQLGSQLRSQLRSQLGSQLRSQLGEYNNDYLFTANVYSNYYVGFYKFIKDEFDISAKIGVMLDSWSELYQKSGVYSAIFSELLCVVSKYPKKVHRNANNDMHNLEASAVEWEANTELTRFKCFYINGRNLPENYFNSILAGKFTMEDFINENNEEYKSTCIAFMQEKYGDEYIVNFFRQNLKEVDTFVDKKDKKYLEGTTGGMNVGVYTLFKGEINDENIAYVRCYCPSTDRMFFLGVESKHNSAKDAIASLYRIPSKLKPHIKSISRQGERFSTILTDEGKRALKQMSEQDIASVTHLTGNDYFKLMKYEF